jgi:hypothetical protein
MISKNIMKDFLKQWFQYGLRGLHAFVALIVSGFVTQVAVIAVVGGLNLLLPGDDRIVLIWRAIIQFFAFIAIGLPMFGFLFSRSYSTSEPTFKTPGNPRDR